RFGVSRDSSGAATAGDVGTISGSIGGTTQLINNDELESDDRLNVNLPVPSPAGTFALALARLPLGTLLEMELSAAQIEGRSEVISSPRVITADAHTATISQGIEVPYVTTDSDGVATTTFREALLSLEVTPQITPDDHIIMDLDVHKDTVGTVVYAGGPSIDSRQVQSQLLVGNGQTVVLGGIYETVESTSVTRVPFFSDLPLIGNLFKTTLTTDDRSELLIFVTPKILQGATLDVR
ncbi:MAG: type IV pilus secretin PilQ, partial [Gammaproteobacteria bacterium]|nr:type IV pilus secretin PilQ [Gammaproteobacteria bacterium]